MNKKNIKAVASFVCIIVLMLVFIIPVSASSAFYSISANYEALEVGDTFDIVIAINDINDDFGLVLAEYKLLYDKECFKLVEWIHNRPDNWGIYFEDISTEIDEGGQHYFNCAYSCYQKGLGVFDNNVLYTTITFKVISSAADGKEFVLKNPTAANDNMDDIICNGASVKINFNSEPVVSQGEISLESEDVTSVSSYEEEQSLTDSQDISSEVSENDLLDETSKDNNDSNVWKILFAILVVIIIILLFAFLISAYRKKKK